MLLLVKPLTTQQIKIEVLAIKEEKKAKVKVHQLHHKDKKEAISKLFCFI